MANDPHLSKKNTVPPNDADYEAAHAEIMATERGRRFLIEYATRNRHPDTRILVSTIARLEAAMRDDPPRQIPAVFKHDLTELAAAIARIEAKLAASGMPATVGVSAAERIKDIVLALRDLARRVDATIALAAMATDGAVKPSETTPHVPGGPPPPAIPCAAPNDSLAALRALSEEELIALFS